MTNMAQTADFLVEIGCEELPPKALKNLLAAFKESIEMSLKEAKLSFTNIHGYASPRRMAIMVSDLALRQQDSLTERRGPAVSAAFDDKGNPTKAVQGFARSCGVEVEQLEKMSTDKGEWLVFRQQQAGAQTSTLLPEMVQKALAALPIPKRMRWGNLDDEFVRPVHWLVMMLGDQLVPMTLFGVASSKHSYGHRFHHPQAIAIESPKSYVTQLREQGRVLVDMEVRRQTIAKQVADVATELGGRAVINEALLDEVTGLVEWPVALSGSYDKRFLELPAEALISSMEEHQKYFAVKDNAEYLMPYFITVSNIESADPSQVVAGNERVILPRLSDAAFFWETDRKQPLSDRQQQLKTIVFQNKLGTVYDKSVRVAQLAATIATQIGGDRDNAERAGMLAKCDLVTEMVGEFPDLQGTMGRYYARLDGEDSEVVEALEEQYLPRYAGDSIPATKTGQALSLAEKLDTIVGLFGIGQPPTGVKDPFALRRAALGVLRIIIENKLNLNLQVLIEAAANGFNNVLTEQEVVDQVMQYCYDRLKGYALEKAFKADVFESVLALKPTHPLDFINRLQAVTQFRKLDQAESLAASNKRISNILRKNDIAADHAEVQQAGLSETAEIELAAKVDAVKKAITPLVEKADYQAIFTELAAMRDQVDAFFDNVMVMAEDERVRANRLALLNQTRALFLEVADISYLQQ